MKWLDKLLGEEPKEPARRRALRISMIDPSADYLDTSTLIIPVRHARSRSYRIQVRRLPRMFTWWRR